MTPPTGDRLASVEAVITDSLRRMQERVEQAGGFDGAWDAVLRSSGGGKLLRPRLALIAHDAFAAEADDRSASVAAAFELLHLALLLHDDVIDRDLVRRGAPNLIALMRDAGQHRGLNPEEAERYGGVCAILAGDLLLSSAYRIIGGLEAPVRVRRALLDILDDAVAAAAAGEHADLLSGLAGEGDETSILRTMEQKTARYSFSAPLQAGSLLGGADADTSLRLASIGSTIGIAFQARDDVLGVFGDPERTGKSVLSDLREGKSTLLIAHARKHETWQKVAHLFGDPGLDDEGADALRQAIQESGALHATERTIARLADDARGAIEEAALPTLLAANLRTMVGTATERVR